MSYSRRVACLFLLTSVFFAVAIPVYAQTPLGVDPPGDNALSLSPETAVDMAIKNNLMMEMAKIGTDIKKRKSDLVWNEFLPSISATGTLSRTNWAASQSLITGIGTGTPYTGNGISGTSYPDIFITDPITLPNWSLNGALRASLYLSFALVDGIKSVKLDYDASRISFEKAKLQMEQGVRKMYNTILLLEANVALLEDSFENTKRQADMAEANYRAGLVPRLTLLQAQVAVENMKPAMNELENTLNNLKGNFALILGLSYDAPFRLEPVSAEASFIPGDVGQFISRSASGKPDIQELQANLLTLTSQRKALAMRNYTPFLQLDWSLSSVFAGDPWKDDWFNGDNWTSKGQAGGAFSVTLGISLSSLLPFSKEGQQLKDMKANIQMQNIALAQMVRETELEIFNKINSLEMIRASAEAQRATVDMAEQSYRLTEEAYRAGLQDYQSVRASALAYDQAKLQLLTQQFNYLNDLIDLEYSIGVPFGTLSGSAK